MNKNNTYPLLFQPVYKDYIWGGHRIPDLYNRDTDQAVCAESWEISDRHDGMSIITNGDLKGKSLHDAVSTMGKDLLGRGCQDTVFPLLVKLIDAKQNLSVQVHPDDETADKYGGEAKTECWLTLAGDADACVFAGLQSGTTEETFKQGIENEELERMICKVPAVEGEAIYIPGGRVHAIAEGCLLLEVQQNSNTTYRVYDWGRVGNDGNPRELHIDQAFQVINWNDTAPTPSRPVPIESEGKNNWFELIKSPYFHMTRLDLSQEESLLSNGESFRILFVSQGTVRISGNGFTETLRPGVSCLLPAALEVSSLVPIDGPASAISITL